MQKTKGYFDYNKLWIELEKQGKNKLWLRQNGIASNTISKLQKNQNVNTSTILELCSLLNVTPAKIMTYRKTERNNKPV